MPNELGRIIVTLADGDIDINLDDYIPIDENNLTHEFAVHATKYAYLAMVAAEAEIGYLSAKEKRERKEQETIVDMRATEAKVTDKTATAMAALAAKEEIDNELAFKAQHLMVKAVLEAMSSRKDMLISLGAHIRAEQDMTGSTIRSNAGQAARDLLREIHQVTSESE